MEKKYKWYGVSDSLSFEQFSDIAFIDFNNCRASMQKAAVMKMCWNTEITDFDLGCNTIHYDVNFHKDMVAHKSYSGKYVFIVLNADLDIAKHELLKRMVKENFITETSMGLISECNFWHILGVYAGCQKFEL